MYDKDLLDLFITFTNDAELEEIISLIQNGSGNDAVLDYLNVGEAMWPHIMAMYGRFECGETPKVLAASFEEAVVLMEESMSEAEGLDELTGYLSFADVDWDDQYISEYDYD
jgi:hypothetical protein